ncbi:MAG: hypothetical protein AW07_04024 [Candidatus Accumulibacter sp. SK-11]|nr:MAG: hypothetical protein AW07_04024 [Candidatus Accumulibacter sp. SK-11]HAY29254.1 hypothetical protein [Accumulibacter sp.]
MATDVRRADTVPGKGQLLTVDRPVLGELELADLPRLRLGRRHTACRGIRRTAGKAWRLGRAAPPAGVFG